MGFTPLQNGLNIKCLGQIYIMPHAQVEKEKNHTYTTISTCSCGFSAHILKLSFAETL